MIYQKTCTEMQGKVSCKVYHIKGEMNCEGTNIIYFITCLKHFENYVVSAGNLKSGFWIHESDVKILKEHCATSRDFDNKYCHSSNPLIIHVFSSLRKYVILMKTEILHIFYASENNIGCLNCLPMLVVLIVSLIYNML